MSTSAERPDVTPGAAPGSGTESQAQAAYSAPPPPYAPQGAPQGAPRGWSGRWSAAIEGRRKSGALAAVLSATIPGVGQVYLGYYQRGFVYALIFAGDIALLNSGAVSGMEPLFGIFLGFFWLFNIVDAARRASLYNMALEGLQQTELPQEFKLPGGSGSLAGGVTLIVLGLLFFLHTRFDFSLRWLAEWWPLALVGLGIHLVYKAAQARKRSD